MPKYKKPEEKEITAYPRDYWEGYVYTKSYYNKGHYMSWNLEKDGWCMECKANPCECEHYEWIEPEPER